jgi:hypothetical protein
VALGAIAARITEFGFMANRVAALGMNVILLVNLGMNVILLVNLAWSAVLYVRFLRGRGSFSGPGTLADEQPTGLRRVGGDRGDRLPAAVRIYLIGAAASARGRSGATGCDKAVSLATLDPESPKRGVHE